MNILSVRDAEIVLHGFEQIGETIYFIFRNDALVITNNVEGIQANYLQSSVVNKTIKDDSIRKYLISKGYDSDYVFIEHSGSYYYSGNSV